MNKFTPAKPAGARSVDEITGSRRLRRMRKADWSRRLVQENQLSVNDLIWPIFVVDGRQVREPIAAMPDVYRLSVDLAVKEAERAAMLGSLGSLHTLGHPVDWSKLYSSGGRLMPLPCGGPLRGAGDRGPSDELVETRSIGGRPWEQDPL